MFYPDTFKEKVKKLYPSNNELHSALDTGDVRVGTLLAETYPYDKMFLTISPIPAAYSLIESASNLEDLKAAVHTAKNHLFQEWNCSFGSGKYSEDFKTRVKAAYPNNKALHDALDSYDSSLGNLLQETYPYDKKFLFISSISSFYQLVMSAESLAELQNAVRIANSHPYQEWQNYFKG